MPIYSYHCDDCNYCWEILLSHDIPQKCPKCKGSVTKIISAVGKPIIH